MRKPIAALIDGRRVGLPWEDGRLTIPLPAGEVRAQSVSSWWPVAEDNCSLVAMVLAGVLLSRCRPYGTDTKMSNRWKRVGNAASAHAALPPVFLHWRNTRWSGMAGRGIRLKLPGR